MTKNGKKIVVFEPKGASQRDVARPPSKWDMSPLVRQKREISAAYESAMTPIEGTPGWKSTWQSVQGNISWLTKQGLWGREKTSDSRRERLAATAKGEPKVLQGNVSKIIKFFEAMGASPSLVRDSFSRYTTLLSLPSDVLVSRASLRMAYDESGFVSINADPEATGFRTPRLNWLLRTPGQLVLSEELIILKFLASEEKCLNNSSWSAKGAELSDHLLIDGRVTIPQKLRCSTSRKEIEEYCAASLGMNEKRKELRLTKAIKNFDGEAAKQEICAVADHLRQQVLSNPCPEQSPAYTKLFLNALLPERKGSMGPLLPGHAEMVMARAAMVGLTKYFTLKQG